MEADSRSADNKITRPPNPMGSGHIPVAIKIVQLFLILFPFSLFFQKTTAYLMMFLCLAKLQITLQDVVEVEEMIVPVTK